MKMLFMYKLVRRQIGLNSNRCELNANAKLTTDQWLTIMGQSVARLVQINNATD